MAIKNNASRIYSPNGNVAKAAVRLMYSPLWDSHSVAVFLLIYTGKPVLGGPLFSMNWE